MINDAFVAIPPEITVLKYVDDMTIIESATRGKQSLLQDHLDQFATWSGDNEMRLNPQKCAYMVVSFLKSAPPTPPTLCNQPLQKVNSTKILGVHISDDLKWTEQINTMLRKANGRLTK